MTETKNLNWMVGASLVALVGCMGCETGVDVPPESTLVTNPDQVVPQVALEEALSGADLAVAQLDAKIAFHRERDSGWLDWATVASSYHARAQFSGRYSDFSEARNAYDESFARAPEGVGPFMGRASLRYTLHEFAAAREDLESAGGAAILPRSERTAIASMNADIAFASGDYETASEFIEEQESARDPLALAQLANYRWKTGEREAADELFARAVTLVRRDTARTTAWLELQRGLIDLEAADYQAALAHYRRADGAFPNWYLVEEHIAEALSELGRRDEAIAIYREVVEQTESPELMDALAGALGGGAEASALIARAEELYEARLLEFPEALAGHAFDHFLEHGDPVRAVELAERNHELRPGGEAKTQLATAYLLVRRIDDARDVIEQALTTPFRSVDLYALAAVLLDGPRAEEFAAQAEAIREGSVAEMRELLMR